MNDRAAAPAGGVRRLVVKVGSSILTDAAGRPDRGRIRQLAEQLARCVDDGREVVLVSSGAIACGMGRLGFARRPKALAELQACAAVGQGELMHLYGEIFNDHRQTVAQVLLTQADLADRGRCRNAKHTLLALLKQRVVPIVNENDVVAVEEIAFGDNDRLAALVACLVEAQLLVILSDVDGLLHNGEVVGRIDRLERAHHAMAMGSSKETTTGGMASKLAAARIAQQGGIPMVIANGSRAGVLQQILSGQPVGTLISPPTVRLAFRKWWIAFSTRSPRGAVVVDDGAAQAVAGRGKSLLPSGIAEVRGRFEAGDPIAIVGRDNREIARGLSNFSSSELARIRGLKSREILTVLGSGAAEEAIHRNNLVLADHFEG